MSLKKITQLPEVTSAANTDPIAIVDLSTNTTSKITRANFLQLDSEIQYKTFLTVGTSNADYIVDGTADEVEINEAIEAANAAGGGVVFIKEGTYSINAAISITHSNIQLRGAGIATKIVPSNGNPCNVVSVTGSGVVNVHVENMWLDGNKANNSFGDGLYIKTPWVSTDTHHVFQDLHITNCKNNGIEIGLNGDTRVCHFYRIKIKQCDGNGVYLPFPSNTDSVYIDVVADFNALNGFYVGSANNWFTNCNSFYSGSAGGNNHGWYFAGYNNYLTGCQAQDCFQSGFYMANEGDPTYGTQMNTFVNCQADSNNQNGDPLYGCGMQIKDTFGTQIVGGIYFVRPYPSFFQRVGISLEGTTSYTKITDAICYFNTTDFSDTSSGVNSHVSGASVPTWDSSMGLIDAKTYGAKGDTKRLFGAVASSGSTTVTCAGASFSSTDVGKTVLVYKEQFYGTIRTIASVTNSTTIVLSGTAGATTTSGTGYIVYGTNDSTIIQKLLTYAATFCQVGSATDSNQPIGSGKIRVTLPGNAVESMYTVTSQLTIPVGVILEADGKVANLLANRNTPCITMQAYTEIDRLELENLGGTGILAGSSNAQQQIHLGKIRIWHGIGAQSGGVNLVPLNPVATPHTTGGTLADGTYYYQITAIDSTGGESNVSSEVTSVISGGTNHGSTSLTWSALSGAASYRIYRGTVTADENVYYTSATNSYTDTNASSTSDYPTPPGYALKLVGNEFKIDEIFVKECSIGVYHHSGTDFICDSAFLIGCGTPIRERQTNQCAYSKILLDSCGVSSIYTSLGGVLIDNGCSDISMDIQEFTLTGVSRTLTPIVNVGSLGSASINKDIYIRLQANNSGGTALSLYNVQDFSADLFLSNAVFSSGATNPITTAVVYGTSVSNEINIKGVYSSGITPSSGTIVGTHQYQLAGVTYSDNAVATGRSSVIGAVAAAATTGTFSQPMAPTVITLTPSNNLTMNATGGIAGQRCSFYITTSGTSSFTITFGTNFKSTGTLSTGTVDAKTFTIEFVCKDGTTWAEVARTTAM